jgi:type IV pilus assembly protein PilX
MHTLHLTPHPPRHTQAGFVLIVALILLLVLTILGLAAAQSTSLEERMAGNSRNSDLAFQAAEAGLRAAEDCLNSGLGMCANFSADTAGTYLFNPGAPPPPSSNTTPLWEVAGFWNTPSYVLDYSSVTGTSLPYVAEQPEFIIEKMPPVATPGGNLGTQQFGGGAPSIQLYRITAYGIGGDSSASAMLQSTYQP